MGEDDDPFEGLVLDEAFVRAAGTYEPPARTREALARHRPGSPRAWSPQAARKKSRRRRGLVGLGLVVVVASSWFGAHALGLVPGSRPATGAAAPTASPSPGRERTLVDRAYVPGRCYTWDQRSTSADALEVSCSRPHLFQDVRRTSVHALPLTPFPTEAAWDQITHRACDGFLTAFLGRPLDPDGRYAAGTIRPVRAGWLLGQRDIECGVIFRAPRAFGVPSTDRLTPFSGEADAAHQSFSYPVGTCLRITRADSGFVPCTSPHGYEVVGATTVRGPATPPTDAAFGRLATQPCRRLVSAYVGHPFSDDATEYVGWDPISAAGWRAGERTFDCYLAFSRNGRSVEVTGSHRTGGRTA